MNLGRLLRSAAAGATCALLACDTPVGTSGAGGIGLQVRSASGFSRIDAGRVFIQGPGADGPTQTIDVAPGTTDTISGLPVGAYVVSLEGLTLGEVEQFGQQANVTVIEDQFTTVSITLTSFIPTNVSVSPGQGDFDVMVDFTPVVNAQSYVVEWDFDGSFTNATEVPTQNTSLNIPVGALTQVFARVRSVDPFTTRGVPSGAQSVTLTLRFASVQSGGGHSCGITVGGNAFCWGSDSNGQLGNDTVSGVVTSPVPVISGVSFTAVATGRFHTCGLAASGDAYCWGSNASGQLGDGGATTFSDTPRLVSGGMQFQAISAGWDHTCAVATTAAGFCWGANTGGQLGDNSTNAATSPVAVAGGLSFSEIDAGRLHTCASTSTPLVYCWGVNSFGQIGDGTNTNVLIPTANADARVTNPFVGNLHSCGLIGSTPHCWGHNLLGQLGNTAPELCFGEPCSRIPIAINSVLAFAAVDAGGLFSCGLTNGAPYCWGLNDVGQLGDGTNTDRTTPAPALGSLTLASLSAGTVHTCGVSSAGAVYCWGANATGQLGDGSSSNRSTPVRVTGT